MNNQVCIKNTCRVSCSLNDTCPEFQYCLNSICTKEVQCISNNDCLDDEKCSTGKNGIPQCIKVCDKHPCGRQAECVGKNHQPTCSCALGFFGDPLEGCQRKECDTDTECSEDKVCDRNMCKIACLVKNECRENSICSSEKHKNVCYCQPGYTGDPIKGCTEINWCKLSPCASGAECKSARDRAECTCPANTVGNPYEEGCRKAEECRFNRDCPTAARCTVIDGTRKCTGNFISYKINNKLLIG